MILIFLIIDRVLETYSLLLLFYALIHFFPEFAMSKIGKMLERIVSPILKPLSKWNLQIGPFDLTIPVAYMLLNILAALVRKVALLW